MKKLILLILTVLIAASAFTACSLTPSTNGGANNGENGGENGGNEGGGGSGDVKEPENLIYNASSELNVVISSDLDADFFEQFWLDVYDYTGNFPKITRDDIPEVKHEIVIGRTNREISKKAYEKLDATIKAEGEQAMVFYSDGASLAVAYDDDKYGRTLEVVLDELCDKYVKTELVLERGYSNVTTFDLLLSIKEKDEEERELQWKIFASNLTAYNSDEIVSALKGLYDLYDEGMATWMASLLDPDICVCDSLYGMTECTGENVLCGTAGFYFTQSGRDTVGHLPNVEATGSIYSYLVSSGMKPAGVNVTDFIPAELGEKIVAFVYNLQDPDGFFYHPQWGKNITAGRLGRDLSNSVELLKRYGVSPKYRTVNDTATSYIPNAKLPSNLGESSVSAVSRVVAAETYIAPELQTLDAFREYLYVTLDITNRSYHAGNTLGAQWAQIKARGQAYVDMLGEFLDSTQRTDNGIWHKDTDYYGNNGLMKISCVYESMQREFPNADLAIEAAISALTSSEEPGGIVDVWNPWVSISNLIDNAKRHKSAEEATRIINAFYAKAPAAIKATTKNIAKYKKPDGSFSYTQEYACSTMQNAPCGVPNTAEGDIDAMKVSSNSMVASITAVLGMKSYAVPFYGDYEGAIFLEELEKRGPVRKAPTGHNLSEWENDEKESCTDPSTKSRYCLGEGCEVNGVGCDYKITITDAEDVGTHTVEIYVPNNDATCNGYGTMTGICSICDNYVTVSNPNDPPNGDHTVMNIVKASALKSFGTDTTPSVYYKSCSTCGFVVTGSTFRVDSGDVTDAKIWSGLTSKNYESGAPKFLNGEKSSGAYCYIATDDESSNSYMRFEKVDNASDLFIYLSNDGLKQGATKYVYEFDIRWGGAVNDGKTRAFYSAPDDSAKAHVHKENWYQLNSTVVFNSDGTSSLNFCNTTSLQEGEWYTIRYEFNVKDGGGYELDIYVDEEKIRTEYTTSDENGEPLPLTFTGDGKPVINITMWKGSTPDTMIFDIDNFSYYNETK